MMDENYLVNLIKEKLCYVSLDFLEDLKITKKRGELNTIKLDYVLPDYINNHTGYIKVRKKFKDNSLKFQLLRIYFSCSNNFLFLFRI